MYLDKCQMYEKQYCEGEKSWEIVILEILATGNKKSHAPAKGRGFFFQRSAADLSNFDHRNHSIIKICTA